MNTKLFNEFKNSIVKQIVNNEIYGNENKFQCRGFYPENVIVWMTTKQKAFKIVKLNKIVENGEKIYEIEYKDVNTASDVLEPLYETIKYKREKKLRKGLLSNEPVSTKFLHINDQFRQELECPNWSNEIDKTGYAACPNNNKEYERLSREDSISFEHFTQWLGYDNYQDFIKYNEFGLVETEDEINQLYQQFLEGYNIPEYAY